MKKEMFKCCKCNTETKYKQFKLVFYNDDGYKKYSCYRHLISFKLCSECAKEILDLLKGRDK